MREWKLRYTDIEGSTWRSGQLFVANTQVVHTDHNYKHTVLYSIIHLMHVGQMLVCEKNHYAIKCTSSFSRYNFYMAPEVFESFDGLSTCPDEYL